MKFPIGSALISKLFRPLIKINKKQVEFFLAQDESQKNFNCRTFKHTLGYTPQWMDLASNPIRKRCATILYNTYVIKDGIVVCCNGKVDFDSILLSTRYLDIQSANHLIIFRKMLCRHPIKCCILLNNPLSNNYFHWLIESIGSIIDYDFKKIDEIKFIIKPDSAKFIKESLFFFFNIKQDNIITKTSVCISVKKLIQPSNVFYRHEIEENITNIYDSSVLRMLNKSGRSKIKMPDKLRYIFISRKKATQRRIENENEIIDALKLRGIHLELISCEDYTFKEQVELFAASKIIISPHGAGLSNLVFADKNSIVIEIFPDSRLVRDAFFFYQITETLDIHHLILKADTINSLEDMKINPDQIDIIFDFISDNMK